LAVICGPQNKIIYHNTSKKKKTQKKTNKQTKMMIKVEEAMGKRTSGT
jgi:hypothetical protein